MPWTSAKLETQDRTSSNPYIAYQALQKGLRIDETQLMESAVLFLYVIAEVLYLFPLATVASNCQVNGDMSLQRKQ
jgi:hypothetical protein